MKFNSAYNENNPKFEQVLCIPLGNSVESGGFPLFLVLAKNSEGSSERVGVVTEKSILNKDKPFFDNSSVATIEIV